MPSKISFCGRDNIFSLVGKKKFKGKIIRGKWLKHPWNSVCILGTQNFHFLNGVESTN